MRSTTALTYLNLAHSADIRARTAGLFSAAGSDSSSCPSRSVSARGHLPENHCLLRKTVACERSSGRFALSPTLPSPPLPPFPLLYPPLESSAPWQRSPTPGLKTSQRFVVSRTRIQHRLTDTSDPCHRPRGVRVRPHEVHRLPQGPDSAGRLPAQRQRAAHQGCTQERPRTPLLGD